MRLNCNCTSKCCRSIFEKVADRESLHQHYWWVVPSLHAATLACNRPDRPKATKRSALPPKLSLLRCQHILRCGSLRPPRRSRYQSNTWPRPPQLMACHQVRLSCCEGSAQFIDLFENTTFGPLDFIYISQVLCALVTMVLISSFYCCTAVRSEMIYQHPFRTDAYICHPRQ